MYLSVTIPGGGGDPGEPLCNPTKMFTNPPTQRATPNQLTKSWQFAPDLSGDTLHSMLFGFQKQWLSDRASSSTPKLQSNFLFAQTSVPDKSSSQAKTWESSGSMIQHTDQLLSKKL